MTFLSTTIATESDIMNRKIISVSKKRQITIPLQFYKHLDLENEVECSLVDGAIVIRPLRREPSEFSVEILKDLVSQGYSGDELVKRFKIESENIKKAVTNILEEADAIASGGKKAATFDDVFGPEG
jgi:bifunctional DNA-binding transcriptional regulator/antitoxin component of YhaV-PrlF toxin-antitoxin module